jgi:hypothetical protein
MGMMRRRLPASLRAQDSLSAKKFSAPAGFFELTISLTFALPLLVWRRFCELGPAYGAIVELLSPKTISRCGHHRSKPTRDGDEPGDFTALANPQGKKCQLITAKVRVSI